MNSITSIALSGLEAARQRLDVASNNVANAATTGALPGGSGAYTPQRTVQQSLTGGDVKTSLASVDPSVLASSQPDSSAADGNGLVAAPNVDLTSAAVDQTSALQAYQASAELVQMAGRLTQNLLDSTATPPRRSVSI
jgi:flagellar basal-body rod protein FlgC